MPVAVAAITQVLGELVMELVSFLLPHQPRTCQAHHTAIKLISTRLISFSSGMSQCLEMTAQDSRPENLNQSVWSAEGAWSNCLFKTTTLTSTTETNK